MENFIVEACVQCGRAVSASIPVCADGTAVGEEMLGFVDFVGETVSLIMRYSVYRFIYF